MGDASGDGVVGAEEGAAVLGQLDGEYDVGAGTGSPVGPDDGKDVVGVELGA